MGKRIDPRNFRTGISTYWGGVCAQTNYTQEFIYYAYFYKWLTVIFRFFVKFYYIIRKNTIFLTVITYFPRYNNGVQVTKRLYFNQVAQEVTSGGKVLRGCKLNQKQFFIIEENFFFYKLFYKLQRYLEKIFYTALKVRVNISIINLQDLLVETNQRSTIIIMQQIIRGKVKSFQKRFQRNFLNIVQLMTLSCYLKEPKLLGMLIQRELLFNPRRHFLAWRLIRTFIDVFFIINDSIYGVKIQIKGKVGGRLRTSRMIYQRGQIPVQSLKINMRYSYSVAKTKVGSFGIKVWYNLGEVEKKKEGQSIEFMLKNFFKTWLKETTRKKRLQQKKIKKQTKYAVTFKSKNPKKKIKKPIR